MKTEQAISHITQLPVDDQLRIINTIWDQMADDSAMRLSKAQQTQLDERMAHYRANPDSALTESQLREKFSNSKSDRSGLSRRR